MLFALGGNTVRVFDATLFVKKVGDRKFAKKKKK